MDDLLQAERELQKSTRTARSNESFDVSRTQSCSSFSNCHLELGMPNAQKLDARHKALTLNLAASTCGSFAEIGAGQEVARLFLVVGGASGTVAKTISAYDKEVSDDLYGSGSRYVSKQRLEAMVDKEWADLQTQLGKTRGPQIHFFSF